MIASLIKTVSTTLQSVGSLLSLSYDKHFKWWDTLPGFETKITLEVLQDEGITPVAKLDLNRCRISGNTKSALSCKGAVKCHHYLVI